MSNLNGDFSTASQRADAFETAHFKCNKALGLSLAISARYSETFEAVVDQPPSERAQYMKQLAELLALEIEESGKALMAIGEFVLAADNAPEWCTKGLECRTHANLIFQHACGSKTINQTKMKSILNLFKPTQTEVAIREDISRGREKPKQSTVLPGRQSTSSTLGGSELEQLRASLADMDARLQSAIGERDQLKEEFSSYRQSANEDANDLEQPTETCDHSSEKPGSNYLFTSHHRAQLGPLPDISEDSSDRANRPALHATCAAIEGRHHRRESTAN
jgi:hypothetical protein